MVIAGRAAWRMLSEGGYPEGLLLRHWKPLVERGVFKDSAQIDTARNKHNEKIEGLRRWIDPFYPRS